MREDGNGENSAAPFPASIIFNTKSCLFYSPPHFHFSICCAFCSNDVQLHHSVGHGALVGSCRSQQDRETFQKCPKSLNSADMHRYPPQHIYNQQPTKNKEINRAVYTFHTYGFQPLYFPRENITLPDCNWLFVQGCFLWLWKYLIKTQKKAGRGGEDFTTNTVLVGETKGCLHCREPHIPTE